AWGGPPPFLWRLALKMLFQRVHRAVCLVASNVCRESAASIFRSAKDGEWDWIGPYIKEKSVPIAGPAQTTITQEELALAKTLGEEILDQIGLNPPVRDFDRCAELVFGFARNCGGAGGLVKDKLDLSPDRRPVDAGWRASQSSKRGAVVGSIRSSDDVDPAEVYFSVYS